MPIASWCVIADITIFDPMTVTENATYAKGTLPSTGIPHVIVNGIVVMKDSEPLKRFDAGQPIRFEPQQEGRFKPLSWTQEFYVAPIDFGGGVPGSQPVSSGAPSEGRKPGSGLSEALKNGDTVVLLTSPPSRRKACRKRTGSPSSERMKT